VTLIVVATLVLLVPIGLAAASALGVDARPFIVGICFGASLLIPQFWSF